MFVGTITVCPNTLNKIALLFPDLLKSFCECYDMKPHATNIFQDIVNALGAYVQSLFVASQVNTPAGKKFFFFFFIHTGCVSKSMILRVA
jgi:hypothetical protein